jgi:hypothetical protein
METRAYYAIAPRPRSTHRLTPSASRHRVARSEVGHQRRILRDIQFCQALIESLFKSESSAQDETIDAEDPEDPKSLRPQPWGN